MKFGVQVDEALKQQPVCITRDPREPRTYELLAAAPGRVQLSA